MGMVEKKVTWHFLLAPCPYRTLFLDNTGLDWARACISWRVWKGQVWRHKQPQRLFLGSCRKQLISYIRIYHHILRYPWRHHSCGVQRDKGGIQNVCFDSAGGFPLAGAQRAGTVGFRSFWSDLTGRCGKHSFTYSLWINASNWCAVHTSTWQWVWKIGFDHEVWIGLEYRGLIDLQPYTLQWRKKNSISRIRLSQSQPQVMIAQQNFRFWRIRFQSMCILKYPRCCRPFFTSGTNNSHVGAKTLEAGFLHNCDELCLFYVFNRFHAFIAMLNVDWLVLPTPKRLLDCLGNQVCEMCFHILAWRELKTWLWSFSMWSQTCRVSSSTAS